MLIGNEREYGISRSGWAMPVWRKVHVDATGGERIEEIIAGQK
jgi:hypothetical protein